MTETIDVMVENHGMLFLFYPLTEAADQWIEQNVDTETLWLGAALAVEHGFAHDLAEGMVNAGLVVQ